MTHIHKKTNFVFEIGEYRDGDKTYDITIISYWQPADSPSNGRHVEFVDFYFGGYDEETTDHYIERWLDNRAKELRVLRAANDFMDAYRLINEDYLEPLTVDRLKRALTECAELIESRDWRLEPARPKEWFEAERVKQMLNSCMELPGDTSIQITIKRDGKEVTADLYDHAALVTSLYESLEYFQSEL